MKEVLFNFMTLRHLNEKNVQQKQQNSPTKKYATSQVIAEISKASLSSQEKWDYVNQAAKDFNQPLASFLPQLVTTIERFRRQAYSFTPQEAEAIIIEEFGHAPASLLNSSTINSHFAKAKNTLSVNVLLSNPEKDTDLYDGVKIIDLIHLLRDGNAPADAEELTTFLKNPILFPPVVASFIQTGDPSANSPSTTAPDDSKAQKIAATRADLQKIKKALAETEVKHASQIVPKLAQPTDSFDIAPSFELQYSGDTKKSFSPETLDIIESNGYVLTNLPLDGLKKTLKAKEKELEYTLNHLEGKTSEKMVMLGGRFQPLKKLKGLTNLDKLRAPKTFNPYMRPLGIGELRMVEQVNIRYEIGEIAHIENVLLNEKKLRDHTRESSTETYEETESTNETTTEKELETTSRHELSTEAKKVQKDQTKFDFDLKVSASYGTVLDIDASTSYGSSSSKEKSNSVATKYAKDITEKAATEIRESVREKRYRKTIQKITEKNSHELNNIGGQGDIVGIYRWLNKVYDAQVRTHGYRMMYEFNLPEPSAFYAFSQIQRAEEEAALERYLPPTITNIETGEKYPLSPDQIFETNYTYFGAAYKVNNLTPPPADELKFTKAYAERVIGTGNTPEDWFQTWDVPIPDGYHPVRVNGSGWIVFGERDTTFVMHINDKPAKIEGPFVTPADPTEVEHYNPFTGVRSKISIPNSDYVYDPRFTINADVGLLDDVQSNRVEAKTMSIAMHGTQAQGISLSLMVTCKVTERRMRQWQIETYEKIMSAYYELLADYEERARAQTFQQGIQIQGSNPLNNELTVETELKKQCISYMTRSYLDHPAGIIAEEATQFPEIDFPTAYKNSHKIRFFEQAFEWKQMTYKLHPYFWGPKETWLTRMAQESNDPRFAEFLKAGAARVILAVNEGYEEAVAHYFRTGQVPRDEQRFAIGGDLYVDIIEELRAEQASDPKDVTPPWRVTLPTNLVVLDNPVAIERISQVFNEEVEG